jgi:hypothetical protein
VFSQKALTLQQNYEDGLRGEGEEANCEGWGKEPIKLGGRNGGEKRFKRKWRRRLRKLFVLFLHFIWLVVWDKGVLGPPNEPGIPWGGGGEDEIGTGNGRGGEGSWWSLAVVRFAASPHTFKTLEQLKGLVAVALVGWMEWMDGWTDYNV